MSLAAPADDLEGAAARLGVEPRARRDAQAAFAALDRALVAHLRDARALLGRADLPDDRGPREWLRLDTERLRALLAEARERLRSEPDDPRGAYAPTRATLRFLCESVRRHAQVWDHNMAPYARRMTRA